MIIICVFTEDEKIFFRDFGDIENKLGLVGRTINYLITSGLDIRFKYWKK